jgi:hypothetical protein
MSDDLERLGLVSDIDTMERLIDGISAGDPPPDDGEQVGTQRDVVSRPSASVPSAAERPSGCAADHPGGRDAVRADVTL